MELTANVLRSRSVSIFTILFFAILCITTESKSESNTVDLESVSVINWVSNNSDFDEVYLQLKFVDITKDLLIKVSPFNNASCSDDNVDFEFFKTTEDNNFYMITLQVYFHSQKEKYLLCVKHSDSAWNTHELSFQYNVNNPLKETEYIVEPNGLLSKNIVIYKTNKQENLIEKLGPDNITVFENKDALLSAPEIDKITTVSSKDSFHSVTANDLSSPSTLLKVIKSYNELKQSTEDFETSTQNNVNNIQSDSQTQATVGAEDSLLIRRMRRLSGDNLNTSKTDSLQERKSSNSSSLNKIQIIGFRVEQSAREVELSEDGIPQVLSNSESILRLFGSGFSENTVVCFTFKSGVYGGPCLFPATEPFRVMAGTVSEHSVRVKVTIPESGTRKFHLCAKEIKSRGTGIYTRDDILADKEIFIHQGSDTWLQIQTFTRLLPIWASIMIILVCLAFSALFSGLNLGLMSINRTDLKILCNTGTETERRFARLISPVRDHGNYLLCSILLGNVLVNSTFTILMEDITSGVVAVVISTLAIVIFGEITPQAICSRHGLSVGARTVHITKAIMIITAPLSWPVSKILDFLLGEEIGSVYNRERLKELVKVTTDINDLDKDEVNIISGALELRKKLVSEVMTHIEDIFMLDYEAVLDFETVSEIMKSGFSRIPVYENSRNNIVTMLYIKDLAFVDPDDNTPLKTLCQFYQNPCNFVFEDVTLDVMFKQFKDGHKGHMAFVHRVNNEGEGDPFYETVGLITLEDVIEELIQAEIMDETDVFTDNRSKRRRLQLSNKTDFTVFAERQDNRRIRISPQLTLATFQYLSTSVDAFKPDIVSENILRRLLKQDVVHHIKLKQKDFNLRKEDRASIIYQQGKAVDFFVLILEGRVEVIVGRENLIFESGPFTYFGIQALVQTIGGESPNVLGSLQSLNMDTVLRHSFVPDYSVRAITDVIYVAIKRPLYLAAKRATLLERSQKYTSTPGEQNFDDEVEKLMHSLDEEDNNSISDTTDSKPVHNSEKFYDKTKPNSAVIGFKGPVSASPMTQSSFNNKRANSPGPTQGLSTLVESLSQTQTDGSSNSEELTSLLKHPSTESKDKQDP